MDDKERAQAVALLQRARDLCVKQMWAASARSSAPGAERLGRLLDHIDAAIAELDEFGFAIPLLTKQR